MVSLHTQTQVRWERCAVTGFRVACKIKLSLIICDGTVRVQSHVKRMFCSPGGGLVEVVARVWVVVARGVAVLVVQVVLVVMWTTKNAHFRA